MDGLRDLNGIQSPQQISGSRDFYEDPPNEDLRSLPNVVLQPKERACCDYYDVKGLVDGVSYSLTTVMDMLQTLTCRVNDVDKVTNSVLTQVTTLKWLTHEMQRKLETHGVETSAKISAAQFADSLFKDPGQCGDNTPSTVTGSNKKYKSKLDLSGYEDIVFTVTDSENDDEDYNIIESVKGYDLDVKDPFEFEMVDKYSIHHAQTDKGKGKMIVENDYCGVQTSKGIKIAEPVSHPRSTLTGKTLFHSPPNPRVMSISATIHDNPLTPPTTGANNQVATPTAPVTKRKTTSGAVPFVKSAKPYGYTLPRVKTTFVLPSQLSHKKSRFRPIPEMELTQKEVQMCAYIFNPELEGTEIILRCGQSMALRLDLECLCPGRRVSDEVMKFFTLKVTWGQYRSPNPQIWCLPPSFSEGVEEGVPLSDMLACFVTRDKWMPAYPKLKYIYAPVRDETHWYLMVVSIDEEVIYHLDSYLPVEKMNSRKTHIRDMAEVIAKMIQSDCYPTGYMQKAYALPAWDITDAKGIPNCGRSDDSSIWVIDWLDMEHVFQNNLIGVLKDKVVRMRAALSIVSGGHNEYYESVVKKAMMYWKSIVDTDKV